MTKHTASSLDHCLLASVTSPQILASRLSSSDRPLSVEDLEALADKTGADERQERLQGIRNQIRDLLLQTTLPVYAHALRNEIFETGSALRTQSPDLAKRVTTPFSPSTSSASVVDFIENQLQCATEVAALLARLLTVDGHLPVSSSASPVLAYFINRKMYDSIESFSTAHGLEMTLHVDQTALLVQVNSPRPPTT